MAFYTFKRNCKVYLVTSVNSSLQKFKLDVYPDLSFSQTFDEQAFNVKTLHDQNAMFESAVINKANPANFSFTILLNNSADHKAIGNVLTFANPIRDGSVEALFSSDVYIDTGVDVFKLTKCVFERATYQIARQALVTVSVSGSASQLSRFGPTGAIIPGTAASVAASIPAIIPKAVSVELDSVALLNIATVTLELVNEVQWLKNDTLHNSLNITGPTGTIYPEAFIVSSKTLSGTIQQYLTDGNETRLNSWSTNSSLNIKVGQPGPTWFLNVQIPSVVFTNRLESGGEMLMQTYDFRMLSNPTDLTTVINYNF